MPGDPVDELLRRAVDAGSLPGVVAVAGTADVSVYEGACGWRSTAGGSPMQLDTVVWIASMTKAVTATAALQLVERGQLSLDAPAAETLPQLAGLQVLEGFDEHGTPRLRPPRQPPTLRHLLTHTSGFGYDFFNAMAGRYMALTGTPPVRSCRKVALGMPLMFDPGDRWEYGIGIDWVGQMVEAVSGQRLDSYFREHLFEPIGMHDTAFRLSPAQQARLASVHRRDADGRLAPVEFGIPQEPEFHMGGDGLYSTARDYLAFMRVFLRDGACAGGRVLRPETVALMAANHIGALDVAPAASALPMISHDVDWFPGIDLKWGLSFLINMQATPTGRAAGSLAWAGLANTYFWIDRATGVAGVMLSQLLPFYDPAAVQLFNRFERAIYDRLQ